MVKLTEVLKIFGAFLCKRSQPQGCFSQSFPHSLENNNEMFYYDMKVDSTENYFYVTGLDKNNNYSLVAKFSIIDMVYIWWKTFNNLTDDSRSGQALALYESKNWLAVRHEDDNNTKAFQISIHNTGTGTPLFPFYRIETGLNVLYQRMSPQFTFDLQGNLWIVDIYEYGLGFDMFGDDKQFILKLIVSDTGLAIGYRKYLENGTIGSVYRMPTQNIMFFGGAVAISNSQHMMTLYKLNSSTSKITNTDFFEINLLYYNGSFYPNPQPALYINKMVDYYDSSTNTYMLFFVTEMRKKNDYGRNGSHVACRTTWSDSTYQTMNTIEGLTINYSRTNEKVVSSIMVKTTNILHGFSNGDKYNQDHVYWIALFPSQSLNFFYIYPRHEIYASYLSKSSLTGIQLNPSANWFVYTGFIAGCTREYLLNEDGAAYSGGKRAGLITTLRIGDQNCGVMTTTYDQENPVPPGTLQFAFYNSINTFTATTQNIFEHPKQTLTMSDYEVVDLDYAKLNSNWQACDSRASILTDTPGSFSDKFLFTDSVSSYPLSCPFQRALATSSCSQYFMLYTVDQSSLPKQLVTVNSHTQQIVIQQPIGFTDADYPITVYGYMPNTGLTMYTTSFTFTLKIRQSTTETTCTSTIPCSMTTQLVSIATAPIPDQLYYYTFNQGSVTPSFTTSAHQLCSESDIVYEYTITPSNQALDTQFIIFSPTTHSVSWYSDLDQGDSSYLIVITAKIDLTTLGQIATTSTSFTLVCRGVCSSSLITIQGSPIQDQFVYTQGDPARSEKLLLFDGNQGKCLQTYSFKMFDVDSNKELPQEINLGALDIGFNSLTRTLLFYATDTTVEFVQLRLEIYTAYGQLQGTLFYSIEILVNNPPIFGVNMAQQTVRVPCQSLYQQWSYAIPDTIDPENDPVTIQIDFDERLPNQLLFNQATQTLSLNQTASQPASGLYNSNFTLYDTRNASTTYPVNIQISCTPRNKTQAVSNTTIDEEWDEFEEEVYVETEVTFDKPQKPIPRIKSFAATGKVQLQWDQKMKMLTLSKKFKVIVGRTLQTTNQENQEEKLAQLKVDYLQNSDKSWIRPEELDFEYQVKWTNEQTSTLEIKFQKPESASAEIGREDILQITFNDTHAFQSQAGEMVPLNYHLTIKVPRQFAGPHLDDDQIETISETSKNLARATLVSSLLLQGVANQLLSLIKNLTVVIHMFILALPYPVNTQKFFAALFPMVTFDVIPADEWIYEPLWGFDQVEPEGINTQFEELGYDNILFIMNMGSMFLILIWIPIKAFLVTIAYYTVPKVKIFRRIQQTHKTLANSFFQEVESTYLIVIIMCLVNLLNSDYSSVVWRANTLSALGFFLVYILTPIHIVLIYSIKIHYSSNREEYQKLNAEFFKTHGSMIEAINVCRVGKYNSIFLVFTQFLYYFAPVTAIFVFIHRPIWSIFTFLWNQLFFTSMFLHFWPFWTLKDNLQMFYEKVVLFITIYFLFTFTQWTDFATKQNAGNFVIVFIVLQSVLLITILLINSLKNCYSKASRKRFLTKERLKYRNKVKQQLQEQNTLQETTQKPKRKQKQILNPKQEQNNIISEIFESNQIEQTLVIKSQNEQNKLIEQQNTSENEIKDLQFDDIIEQLKIRSELMLQKQQKKDFQRKSLLETQDPTALNYALNIRQELLQAIDHKLDYSKEPKARHNPRPKDNPISQLLNEQTQESVKKELFDEIGDSLIDFPQSIQQE